MQSDAVQNGKTSSLVFNNLVKTKEESEPKNIE